MCGIVGYIGTNSAAPIVLKGLQRLEYRGYDSAGIALIDHDSIALHKTKGKVADLRNLHDFTQTHQQVAIGHTRWATHG